MLVMDENYHNHLFEVFEPDVDEGQIIKRDTIKKQSSFFGMNRILLDSHSNMTPSYNRDEMTTSKLIFIKIFRNERPISLLSR